MNYPNGIQKKSVFHNINYKNRGMDLESDLNITNEYYREINKAFIYKKPTPIKIVDVDYVSRQIVTIKKAYFMEPSTTDYNGLYNGKYIDFEAKETKNKTSFPLNNIHTHQIKHIRNIYINKGIVFLIVRFTKLDMTYLLLGKDFLSFIDNNRRKSIPINYFEKVGYKIEIKLKPRVDYLEIIDKIYGGTYEKY